MNKCVNNCGFYGNVLTNNYCSKCFKDLQTTEKTELTDTSKKEVTGKQKNVNKCWICNVKIGLTGIKCGGCEYVFCSKHRYPEKHECSFDYKSRHQLQLFKNNPIIIAEKITKI